MCNIHLVSMKSFVHSISTPLPVLKLQDIWSKEEAYNTRDGETQGRGKPFLW